MTTLTTLKYPITVANGTLVLTSDESIKAEEVIRHILLTEIEERPMIPEFGIYANEFDVVYSLPDFLREIEGSLRVNLAQYPGIDVRLTGFLNDSGRVDLTCFFSYEEQAGQINILLGNT